MFFSRYTFAEYDTAQLRSSSI